MRHCSDSWYILLLPTQYLEDLSVDLRASAHYIELIRILTRTYRALHIQFHALPYITFGIACLLSGHDDIMPFSHLRCASELIGSKREIGHREILLGIPYVGITADITYKYGFVDTHCLIWVLALADARGMGKTYE